MNIRSFGRPPFVLLLIIDDLYLLLEYGSFAKTVQRKWRVAVASARVV